MKKELNILIAGALALAMSACSGNVDPDGNGGNTEIEGPFTLSVDKAEIEADGKDAARLILTDANGNVLTDTDQLKYITFDNITNGTRISRANEFTAIQNGEYTFSATYKNSKSENTVKVTAKNRVAYEKYFRKVALHELTDVKCGYCPQMVTAIENVPEIYRDQMVVLAVHGGFSEVDPWNISGIGSNMMRAFKGSGWPYTIFNLSDTYSLSGTVNNSVEIAKIVEKQLRDNPSTCGIKVSSVLTPEGDVKIGASIKSDKGGDYNLGYAVVKDNCMFVGGTMPGNIYNDVVIGITSNYMSYSQQNAVTLGRDEEHKMADWTFDASEKNLCVTIDDSNKSDCRVIVYALRYADGKTVMDNVVECPLGGSVDYVLNK